VPRSLSLVVLTLVALSVATSSSAQIRWGRPGPPTAGACFYEHINFEGDYFCTATGSATPQVPDGSNDRISSIRVFGKATVTAFRDANFKGRSHTFEKDVRDLRKEGWNDRISSFRIESPRSPGPFGGFGGGTARGPAQGLQAFDNIKFGGKSATFLNDVPDLRQAGMGGSISSLKVPAGQSWQVCSDVEYKGRCRVVTSDVSDLRSGEWNDVIYSLRRLR
jgi:hypothetical protein